MRNFKSDILLNGNQIKEAVLDNVSSRPTSPQSGRIIQNTTLGKAEYYDGNQWITLDNSGGGSFNPERVITVGQDGCDFNLNSTSTPITDAIASISPSATTTVRYLIKIYPGVYTENITIPEYVILEGSGLSSIIKPNSGSQAIQFSGINGEIQIKNIKIETTNSNAISLNNTNLSILIENVTIETIYSSSSSTDRTNIKCDAGTIDILNCRLTLLDDISGNSTSVYNSNISLSTTSLIQLNCIGCKTLVSATNSTNHNMIFLKSNNSNANTRVNINTFDMEIRNLISNTENVISAISLESSRGIYRLNNSNIKYTINSVDGNFLSFCGFVHNSLGTNDTELFITNCNYYCKNIDSDKLFTGSIGTQYDSTIIMDTNVATNTDFYLKEYLLFGIDGKINADIRNNFARILSTRPKTINPSIQLVSRQGNWSNFNWNDFFRWKSALAMLRMNQNSTKRFIVNFCVPRDCNEILNLYCIFVPISNPNGGNPSMTYESTIVRNGINESLWPDGNGVTFNNPSYTLGITQYDNIIGVIPSNLRTELASEWIGIQMEKQGNNFDYRFIGFELEYR